MSGNSGRNMRREDERVVFSSVITLEKKGWNQNSKNKKTGLNSQKRDAKNKKTGLNSQKSQGKKKKCSFVKSWFCGKQHTGSFFGRKKSESHPSFFISKKKKKKNENEKS